VKISAQKKRKLSFFSIYFTFILDNLGWSLVIPIFGPLFLGDDSPLFSPDACSGTKTILLGLFLGAFPFAQFIGAPILGDYGDMAGRKKAFVMSIALTFVGYFLTAWAISSRNLILLFVGRLISGLFAGNLSICMAAIADLSSGEKAKTKNFGYLSAMAGFSLIIGAFLGGFLADSRLSSLFSPDFPLWIASALSLLNLLFVIFTFHETRELRQKVKFHFFESFKNIRDGFKQKNIKNILLIYFLFILSWGIFFQISPVLTIKRFNFSYSQIGSLAALIGICWAFGSVVISKVVSSRLSNLKILEFSLIMFILPYSLIGFFHHILPVVLLICFCGMLAGFSWPVCNALISERVGARSQGKMLGITQSMQSLGVALAPIFGGYLANFSIIYPFILAAIFSMIGVVIYIKEKV
jgi:MFS transporter, DHA1 family, tetracycline resistance protein